MVAFGVGECSAPKDASWISDVEAKRCRCWLSDAMSGSLVERWKDVVKPPFPRVFSSQSTKCHWGRQATLKSLAGTKGFQATRLLYIPRDSRVDGLRQTGFRNCLSGKPRLNTEQSMCLLSSCKFEKGILPRHYLDCTPC